MFTAARSATRIPGGTEKPPRSSAPGGGAGGIEKPPRSSAPGGGAGGIEKPPRSSFVAPGGERDVLEDQRLHAPDRRLPFAGVLPSGHVAEALVVAPGLAVL